MIFRGERDQLAFLEIMGRVQKQTRVRVLAYCVLGNHYHVVLQNTTGRMSEFFKQLNGQYALCFRKRHGGRGYVFQDRYKSMLIQDDGYLKVAIAYVLGNPVKAGLAKAYDLYPGSSGGSYFSPSGDDRFIDSAFVEELFGSKRELGRLVNQADELPVVPSELGPVIGREDGVEQLLEKAERRKGRESRERRRSPDKYFEPVAKIIGEFEKMHGVDVQYMDISTHAGKRLRAELLWHLKTRAGMTYRQLAHLDWFADLNTSSMGTLYQRIRIKMTEQNVNRG
jgi:REP element-mobilizing transposase RayT